MTTDTTIRQERGTTQPAHEHPTPLLTVMGLIVAIGLALAAVIVAGSGQTTEGAAVEADAAPAVTAPALAVTGQDVTPALVPKAELAPAPDGEVNVAAAPLVPPAATRTTQAIIEVEMEVVEGITTIDPESGIETETWGYRLVDGDDGVVVGTPGPIIRARVGDVLRLTLTNPASSTHPHNIDLHSVTGQGGGAAATVVAPGESRTIEARLLYPGFFMYHCAYGDVPSHIAHGMHGGILVDPETPLPTVDHEWYVVQSEYYTQVVDSGMAEFDRQAVTDENPSFVVFNGGVGALSGDNTLAMNVGERARIYFINAGLNLDSNFHPIGSHWDKVYQEAALLNQPLRGSQTTLVPAGGGTVVELIGQVPSTLVLVDHALSRTFDKGALGTIVVEGDPQPEIFEEIGADTSAGEPAEGDATTAAGEVVAILAGSGDVAPMDAADEFADAENPADFSVNVLTIPVGTTVTWTNEDSTMHTATAVDGSFDSGYLDQGESFSFTFEAPGEYEYLCTPHPWMRAKVIVEG